MAEQNIELEGKKPLLVVDLKTNGGSLSFDAIEKIKEWFQKEKEFWVWLKKLPGSSNVQRIVRGEVENCTLEIDKAINSYNSSIPATVENIKTKVQSVYLTKKLPYSNTPRYKYISELITNDVDSALCAISYFMNIETNTTTLLSIKGYTNAMLFDHDLLKRGDIERAALETLYQDLTNKLSDTSKRKDALDQEINQSYGALKSLIEKHIEEFKILLGGSADQQEKSIKKAEDALKNIEATYDKKLALQSSIKYWEDKAKNHKAMIWKFVFALFLLFALFTYGFIKIVETFVGMKTIMDLSVSQVGVLSIEALFGVWMLRIFIRILLSNVHLYTEAFERRTMLQTYLALLRKGQVKEKAQELILQALFRPSSTGIIKDDAAPPFLAEWLKRTTGD